MAGGAKTFTNNSRIASAGGGGGVVGPIVSILGHDIDDPALTGLVGVAEGGASSIDPGPGGVDARFMATLALAYGVNPASSLLEPASMGQDNSDAQAVNTEFELLAIMRSFGYNSISDVWDRLRSGGDDTDAQTPESIGILKALSRLTGYNEGSVTWDSIRAAGDDTDASPSVLLGALLTLARNTLYNDADWDRWRSASGANMATVASNGAALVTPPGNWSVFDTPAAATQATITRSTGSMTTRQVCTSIDAVLIIPEGVNQPALTINLIDGATGGGVVLWSRRVGIGAVLTGGGQQEVSLAPLNIIGSPGTDMTLEFSAAGAATTLQSVAFTGYDVPA